MASLKSCLLSSLRPKVFVRKLPLQTPFPRVFTNTTKTGMLSANTETLVPTATMSLIPGSPAHVLRVEPILTNPSESQHAFFPRSRTQRPSHFRYPVRCSAQCPGRISHHSAASSSPYSDRSSPGLQFRCLAMVQIRISEPRETIHAEPRHGRAQNFQLAHPGLDARQA